MQTIDIIRWGMAQCQGAGMTHPTLEECVFAVLRGACKTMRNMPDREAGWLRHALSRFPVKPNMNEEYAESPKIRLLPTPEDVGRMEVVMHWFGEIRSDGRRTHAGDEAERLQIARTVTYMFCADVPRRRVAKVVGLKSGSLGPYFVWGLAHISEWLWENDDDVRALFPLVYRLPDAFYRWGEHYLADTPRERLSQAGADRNRWKGLTSPPDRTVRSAAARQAATDDDAIC